MLRFVPCLRFTIIKKNRKQMSECKNEQFLFRCSLNTMVSNTLSLQSKLCAVRKQLNNTLVCGFFTVSTRVFHMYLILCATLHFDKFSFRRLEVFPANDFHRVALISQIVDISHGSWRTRRIVLEPGLLPGL